MAKIIGHGAPTSKTFGVLGQEYFDKDSNKVYTCTKVTHKTAYRAGEADAEYEWTVIGNDPFEIKMEPVDLVLNQDVLFQYHPDDQYRWEDICPCEPLVADQEYTVIWDGVKYKCFGIYDEGVVYIGNPGLWWPDEYEDDGTPFCFDVEDGYLKCCIHAPGEEVTHNITVSTVNRIINKIDYEFMPDGYPKVKTEVVERVPTNPITASDITEFENGVTISDAPFVLEYGKKYVVTINGKEYTGECFDMGSGPALDIEENGKRIFWIAIIGFDAEIYWNAELGETINLGLSEVKEIVTPMDPRFAGIEPDMIITLMDCNLWETFENVNIRISGDIEAVIHNVIEKIWSGLPVDIRVRNIAMEGSYMATSDEIKANVMFYGGALVIKWFCLDMWGTHLVSQTFTINEAGIISNIETKVI